MRLDIFSKVSAMVKIPVYTKLTCPAFYKNRKGRLLTKRPFLQIVENCSTV